MSPNGTRATTVRGRKEYTELARRLRVERLQQSFTEAETLAQQLYDYRNKHGLTLDQLAARLGFSRTTLLRAMAAQPITLKSQTAIRRILASQDGSGDHAR